MKELLSPKQVAASIGVSESSLKRWCDQGFIPTERTPGGHRRIRLGEAIRFLRDRDHQVVRPEVLGLPAGVGRGPRAISNAGDALLSAMQRGDGEQCRRLVLDLYLSGVSIIQICHELITPALHAVGEGWQGGTLDVFQEHQACEVLNRVLYDLRTLLPPPGPGAPVAVGGTPPGDNYRLATLMVELVLVDVGWNAISLGTSLPFASLTAAARLHRPELLWLSCSHAADAEALQVGFAGFLSATPDSMRVVVGGQRAEACTGTDDHGDRVVRCSDLVELCGLVTQRDFAPSVRPAGDQAGEG